MSATTVTPVGPAITQEELPKIAEGETKVIRDLPKHPHLGPMVLIGNTDAVKAHDGLRKRLLPEKGAVSCGVTIRIFEHLRENGLVNHLVAHAIGLSLEDEYFQKVLGMITRAGLDGLYLRTHFFARKLTMQPFKFVVRRIVPEKSSYLDRYPRTPVGHRFDVPVVEVFLTDNPRKGSLVIFDGANRRLLFHESSMPMGQNYMGMKMIKDEDRERIAKVFIGGQEIALRTFIILEEMFASVGHTLVELEIKVGFDVFGNLILGDDITPDEINLWPDGDARKARDRQKYLDIPDDELTPEMLAELLAYYTFVLELMKAIRGEPDSF